MFNGRLYKYETLTVLVSASDEMYRIYERNFIAVHVADRQNTEQFTRVINRSYYGQGTALKRRYVAHC